jgi:hypothetical protein
MWIEKKFEEDPITAVKLAMASHATGQLVLHVSQGTVCAVVWREKITPPCEKRLDEPVANGSRVAT